ncbi:16407_t:CDS:2 [Acaulospora morrowiae]|uniref:16407_t:CDS:1 n=1 Tax=Acaulospora morrowiae TaxID=94023 RepID=A0A9N8YNL0_9GLOM|nr:16407_t:CDS:2 [Acaulospora morrowiae]
MPSSTVRVVSQLNFTETLKLCFGFFWCGLRDSFALPTSLIIIYGSNTIRNRTLKCFTLNGVLFLGSIFFFNRITLPIIHFILGTSLFTSIRGSNEHSPFIVNFLDKTAALMYQLCWVYPIFLLSFALNAMWYQEIADHAYRQLYGRPIDSKLTYTRLLQNVANDIYRAILFMNYLTVATIAYAIPVFGPLISFMYFCWIYAYYSFEYKWVNQGWTLQQRIDYFEERWSYFAGFGRHLFCPIQNAEFNHFLSAGVFALLFPLYIIMANNALPLPRRNESARFSSLVPYKLRVFGVSMKLNDKIINCIRGKQAKVSRTKIKRT